MDPCQGLYGLSLYLGLYLPAIMDLEVRSLLVATGKSDSRLQIKFLTL